MRHLLISIALVAALAASGCGGDSPAEPHGRTLRIYASQPMTAGRGGGDTVRAIRIAVAHARDAVAGARIEVVGLNDADPTGAWDAALVTANARRAAADPTTFAYIGDFDSGATKLAMPILNRAGILHVTSGATAVALTHPAPRDQRRLQPTAVRTFARVVPNDTVQGAALTAFMREESVRRVFVVGDGDTYGVGLDRQFTALGPASGLRIVGRAMMLPGTDLQEITRRIARSRPDALLFAGSNIKVGHAVFSAAHEADVRLKLFSGDGLALPGFLRSLGDLELDTYVTAPVLPAGNYARSGKAFLSTFRRRYGRSPEPMSVFGYEAGSAIVASLRRASGGQLDGLPMATLRRTTREAFFAIRERPSALGSYSIDPYGDTTLAFYGAYRVENGQLVLGRALDIPPSAMGGAAP